MRGNSARNVERRVRCTNFLWFPRHRKGVRAGAGVAASPCIHTPPRREKEITVPLTHGQRSRGEG